MKWNLATVILFVVLETGSSVIAEEIDPEVLRLNHLAAERFTAHDFDSAERYYFRALDLAERSGTKHTIATLHNNLGVLYTGEYRYRDADRQLRLAYELLKSEYGQQHQKVAEVLNKIGEVSCFEGNFVVARSLFQRSLGILTSQSSSDPQLPRVLTNLAATEWALGNVSSAEKTLQQVSTLYEKTGSHSQPELAFALLLRARLSEQEGDLRRAEDSAQQALSVFEQSGSREDHAAALVTMGQLLLRERNAQQAQPNLERALELVGMDAGEKSAVTGAAMCTLAQCYRMQGKCREAENLFQRAIETYQRVLGPDHPNLLYAMKDYAQFLRAVKRKKDAKQVEAYIHEHLRNTMQAESARNVVDFHQLLLEEKR